MPTEAHSTTPPGPFFASDLTAPDGWYYRVTMREGNLYADAVLVRDSVQRDGRFRVELHTGRTNTTKGAMGARQKERAAQLVELARAALVELARAAGWRVELREWCNNLVECWYQPEPAPEPEPAPAPAPAPCAWCGGNGCKSTMQPAFCADCVQAMLRGEDEARRDLYGPVTDLPPAEPEPEPTPEESSSSPAAPAGAPAAACDWLAEISIPWLVPFTIQLSPEEAAALRQRTAEGNARLHETADKAGLPFLPYTCEAVAAQLVANGLKGGR